ncbi:DUF262 domain-containing protein [Georgenia sp. AZ-5]|uniref:DUF262 domain-containing protein n=1 Tax=Georgenia sp. AZ-5 TaxID=3367526 RepID=UPI0037544C75
MTERLTEGQEAPVYAAAEELGALLSRERRHLIPTYQRDYEWTEEGQWQLLMDDVIDVTDRLLGARKTAEFNGQDLALAEKEVGPHFLGAVVFEALPPRGAHVATCSVIDGQQRLTTIYLLLRALLDVLTSHGLKDRARQIRKLILIRADDVVDAEEVFKLWPRRRDRDAWVAVMDDERPDTAHRYNEARQYFADRIEAAVENVESPESFLSVLVDALSHKIKLVVVDLEPGDDPQLIFEVLNGRQTPLSAADLVKNLLFMRATLPEEQVDALYDKYWSPFDAKWWSGTIGRGHAARGRRDQLLATWLTIQTAEEVNLGRLYGEARTYLSNSTANLPDLLRDIAGLAQEYRHIYERPDGVPKEIAGVYRRMERLGVTTAVPLLAWLRTLSAQRLTPAEHLRAVQAIDSFVVRRMMISAQTRGYGRAFLDILQKAKAAPAGQRIDAVITDALLAAPHGLEWPTDEEITDEFLARSFYGRISQERIRMLLGPIDAHLQEQAVKSEQASFDYDSLTIEHVMPRQWEKHWPVTADDPAARLAAEQDRERHINRIGNLTLITGKLNPSLSNREWSVKAPALDKHSKLELSREIVGLTTWDEAAIDRRSERLARAACAVWTRPLPIAHAAPVSASAGAALDMWKQG